MEKFNYEWRIKDSIFTKDKGTVFSCFACGGGSTMGYKLAGFDVIGCCEIDPRMNDIYVANHNPKINLLMDIRDVVAKAKLHDLPKELYQLDILDGSPPCSSFSIAGEREKGWGKEKKFREGQTKQVLDTLFFDFIELAKYLQPKVVVAENVKGLMVGEAKKYASKIYDEFEKAGYYCQHFLLDASKMGCPQKRERVFFLSLRKNLADKFLINRGLFEVCPYIDMTFNGEPIAFCNVKDGKGRLLSPKMTEIWEKRKFGDVSLMDAYYREFQKQNYFSQQYVYDDEVCKTLTAHEDSLVLYDEPRYTSKSEAIKISTFPLDYNFLKEKPHYVLGMSVPPLMMANVAKNIYEQWLSKL